MYVKTIASILDPFMTKDFVDSSLARGIRDDVINEKVFFHIYLGIDPDEMDIQDVGKSDYISMFPPKLSEKRAEYNQKVSQFIEKNRAMIWQNIYTRNVKACLYRLLCERVALKRKYLSTFERTGSETVFRLTISMGEAIASIFSLVLNQKDIQKKVNDQLTSIDAIGNILQDSLIDDEKMKRLNLSKVLSILNVTCFPWESHYDVSRIEKIRSINDSKICIDIQNAESDINTILDKTNRIYPTVYGTVICDKDSLNHLFETYNIINNICVSDICEYGSDICISFLRKFVGDDSENDLRDIIKRTYGITRD